MAKRRGRIDEMALELDSKESNPKGLHDYDTCVKMFLDEMELKNLAFHTKRWHKENLHYVKQALMHFDLSTTPTEISEGHLKKCILYWKRDCSLAPTTINHRIRSIKQLYAFLITNEMILTSPAEKLGKLKTPKVIIRPFEEDELKRLLAQPDRSSFVGYRDYTIMLILLDTGVRLSELINMKMADVDLQGGKIVVWGKGSKERAVIFQATTRRFLQRYIRLRGSVNHDYLWITDLGEDLKHRTLQERLKMYGNQAGLINVRVSPHTFRHTCAKLYIMKGGDILSLQKLLGHSSLEMVRHYVELWGSDLQQMHKKFSPVEGLFNK